MHLKCIIIIYNNVYPAYKFCGDFIQYNRRSAFSKNKSGKIVATEPLTSNGRKSCINILQN